VNEAFSPLRLPFQKFSNPSRAIARLLGVQGGHNWQIGDDTGGDVYWDPTVHDRKSTLAFSANYWPWKERLSIALKYGFDFGIKQRFKNTTWMLNLVLIPNVLTGG